MRIVICSPCNQGWRWIESSYACQELQKRIIVDGGSCRDVVMDCSDVAAGRNRLVRLAYEADQYLDAILWVDADVSFELDQFTRLWDSGYDFVGIRYRQRTAANRWAHHPGNAVAGADGFAQVDTIGMGFTLMRKDVFECLGHTPFASVAIDEDGNISTRGTRLISEDVFCCERWRSQGAGKIHVDTRSEVKHKGVVRPSDDLPDWISGSTETNGGIGGNQKEHSDSRQGTGVPVAGTV